MEEALGVVFSLPAFLDVTFLAWAAFTVIADFLRAGLTDSFSLLMDFLTIVCCGSWQVRQRLANEGCTMVQVTLDLLPNN